MRTGIVAGLLALGLLAASPGVAQGEVEVAGASLQERMKAWLDMLRGDSRDSLASFLPARGEVTWVLTTIYRDRPTRVGRWRFSRAQVLEATEDGPLAETLSFGGLYSDGLGNRVMREEGGWRRVSRTRFVPPGDPAGSPWFVEWRLEDGRWVLSQVGDQRHGRVQLLGIETGGVMPDPHTGEQFSLPMPAHTRYAESARWFVDNESIVVAGRRIVKYGMPRRILEWHLLERYGSLEGVPVYVETGTGATVPEVVYVLVNAEGWLQPYQNDI